MSSIEAVHLFLALSGWYFRRTHWLPFWR